MEEFERYRQEEKIEIGSDKNTDENEDLCKLEEVVKQIHSTGVTDEGRCECEERRKNNRNRIATWRALRKERETETERRLRLNNERENKMKRRKLLRELELTEDKCKRLKRQTDITRCKREIYASRETNEVRELRLNHEAALKALRNFERDLQETDEERKTRLKNESINKKKCRQNRDLKESKEKRLARFEKNSLSKTDQRLVRDQLETVEERSEGLKLINERESIRWQKRCQNEREDERVARKIHKRNINQVLNTTENVSSSKVWPQIATNETKHRCLNQFKEAMSNHTVDQTICVVCACLHYTSESLKINIAKIPNQHLLYPTDIMPSCVMRFNADIDVSNGNLLITDQTEEIFRNATDSSIIINGMLLCRKGINISTRYAQLCNKCHSHLTVNKLPALSLNNLMWIGDIPEQLQGLTLPEQKLIALYRHSSCVIKLFSITGDSSMAQTALKGNVITFPQSISEIAKSLPLSVNVLPHILKIIFVGPKCPARNQLRSILTVRREVIRKAIVWLHKNNILYKNINIDNLLIETLPINDIPDCLWNTMSSIDQLESSNSERSGYINNSVDLEEKISEDIIPLNTSGLIETSTTSISTNDIARHLLGRMNTTDVISSGNDNIYLIPQGQYPVNEYFNTSFLPGLYPTLFPYGMGGVENNRRQVHVSYSKHIRFFLSYYDHRFEMNTSFIFVTFNILQRRTACSKARILVSRPYFTSQALEINQLTAAEVKTALNHIESNTYKFNLNPRLSALLKQLKTVSGSVMGSNQSRANYRVELHSQIFFKSLPHIFITVNPCDLHHPLVMKFAGIDLDIDHLLVNQMPTSQERAKIVANYPVANARFFNKLIETVLCTLIGYNSNKCQSNPGGGVLGEVDAYYGTVEESGRGALHLHMLIWLVNNKNPHELRELIKDEIFRNNLIDYLEDIIKEDLHCFENESTENDISNVQKHKRTLTSICSPIPSPADPNFDEQKKLSVYTLASENQIHHHTSTCYKYQKNTSIDKALCRLRYPKELHDKTSINIDTGEIQMRREHPMMNNFNEWFLISCRCNMDIKFIWSGADTKALVYYISDYITKKNLSFHDSHALIHKAVENFEKNSGNIDNTDALEKSRRLILRCFNTLASQQEISSVQVACYLMGWPDHYTSHTFVNIYLIGIERFLESYRLKMEKSNTSENTNFSTTDDMQLNMIDPLYENEEHDNGENDKNESFELEDAVDEKHYVLCNKRIDYQLRPSALQNICLYTFFSEFRKAKLKPSDKVLFEQNSTSTETGRRGRPQNNRWLFQSDHPQYLLHMIIRRSFSVIPVLIGPSIPSSERSDTIQRYARAILTLFHPWRNISDIIQQGESWNDALQIHRINFTNASIRVINNIQLLHDCKRDRDLDLFQLVNQSLPSQPAKNSTPFNEENLEDSEEILALLQQTIDLYPSSSDEKTDSINTAREYMKEEYLKSTLANVFRAERFTYMSNMTSLHDFVFNNIKTSSVEIGDADGLIHVANKDDFKQIRVWQHNLKTQKEQTRRALLYGAQDSSSNNSSEAMEVDILTFDSSVNICDNISPDCSTSDIMKLASSAEMLTPNFSEIFSLNYEQTRIFNTVTDHIQQTIVYENSTDINRTKPKQLLMYIGGAGGCGKSRVVEAISAFMNHHNRLHTLRSLAPSSAAAVGINGLTIQSMLREGRNKISSNGVLSQTDIANIETEWRNIDYCLIDEISMVGCHMLARFHKITTTAKHTQPTTPFGGINMIFFGDFVQYPPVLDRPLYLNLLSPGENLDQALSNQQMEKRRSISERDIQCKVGRALWLQVNTVFFLTEQMRNKDVAFMSLQARLRSGQCTDDDYTMLCERIVSPNNVVKSLRESPWNSAPMLVFRNEVRTNINNFCVFDQSIKNKQPSIVLLAHDRVRNHEIDNDDLRRYLLSLPDNKTEGLPGYLPIVANMPVLITHNIATELHISNGSIGELVRVVYDDEDNVDKTFDIINSKFPSDTIYIRKPLYALVKLPQSKLTSSLFDLQPTIIPIIPEQKTIKIDLENFISPLQQKLLKNKTSITITRTQLPIVPAYALTTHKWQGKTLSYGVIDLVPPPYCKPNLADVYVPVSRFTSGETMVILRPFPRSVLNYKPHPDMIIELKRLENIYEQNKKAM